MKLVVPIVFIVFLLFGYEGFLYAKDSNILKTNVLTHVVVQKQSLKTAIQNQSFTFIDETDIDIEEEYFGHDDTQEFEIPNFALSKYSFFHTTFFVRSNWDNINSQKISLRYLLQKKENDTCPLYISQLVLRI